MVVFSSADDRYSEFQCTQVTFFLRLALTEHLEPMQID